MILIYQNFQVQAGASESALTPSNRAAPEIDDGIPCSLGIVVEIVIIITDV